MHAYNECYEANIQIYRSYVVEQVQYYERLSPLVPLKSPLGSFSNIKAGDCLVTFSRRGIYTLKVGIGSTGHCRIASYIKHVHDVLHISKK